MEKEQNEKSPPYVSRETQIAIMKFFLKTSIPRILKKHEEEKNVILVSEGEMEK